MSAYTCRGYRRGENHPAAKLTEEDVTTIAMSDEPSKLLAEYEVGERHIRDVRAGRRWGWLTGRNLT